MAGDGRFESLRTAGPCTAGSRRRWSRHGCHACRCPRTHARRQYGSLRPLPGRRRRCAGPGQASASSVVRLSLVLCSVRFIVCAITARGLPKRAPGSGNGGGGAAPTSPVRPAGRGEPVLVSIKRWGHRSHGPVCPNASQFSAREPQLNRTPAGFGAFPSSLGILSRTTNRAAPSADVPGHVPSPHRAIHPGIPRAPGLGNAGAEKGYRVKTASPPGS